MKNKKIFWILIVINVVFVISDLILTYLGTPDLTNEGNPLISRYGSGWTALFIANGLGIIFVTILIYYAFKKYQSPYIPYKTIKEYTSMLFYNRPDKFWWSFYKLPKKWKSVFACSSFAVGIALIAVRPIPIIEWMLIITDSSLRTPYKNFRALFPSNRFDLTFCATLIIFLIIYWVYKEYRNNRRLVIQEEQEETVENANT
jgi:hypothetical protein